MKFRELGGLLCMQGGFSEDESVVYKACFRSVLMYGAETWVMKVGVFSKLRATERRMLTMMCKVALNDKVESTVTALRVGMDNLEELLGRKD